MLAVVLFLHTNVTLQDFLPKLRKHIFPRIQDLRQEVASLPENARFGTIFSDLEHAEANVDASSCVFFKNDRIYHHKLTRFHFTTYDVRRGTDTINPGTSRRNIMLLADDVDSAGSSSKLHRFLYARVLGVYHANVIYTGPGMHGYEARRLDFLWVRWYEVVDTASSGWVAGKLDSLRFPPMNGEDAFAFVDPKDVLRGCHIMPRFAKGKRHADGIGVSRCAKDGNDYHRYYIGRCVRSWQRIPILTFNISCDTTGG